MKENRSRPEPATKRPRWTREKARAVFEEFSRSGLSLAAFAQREGVKLPRLQVWQRRFRSEPAQNFREVVVKATSDRGESMFELVFPSDLILRFGVDVDHLSLGRVVSALVVRVPC